MAEIDKNWYFNDGFSQVFIYQGIIRNGKTYGELSCLKFHEFLKI